MGWVLECRHGRVLYRHRHIHDDWALFVSDPMVGDTHHVSLTPSECWAYTAALVCAAGHDDHTDCHLSPFQIILVENIEDDEHNDLISSRFYSSETGTCGSATTMTSSCTIDSEASTLVHSSLYWLLGLNGERSNHILELELPRQRLALIELPEGVNETYTSDIHVMLAEDGGIDFTGVFTTSIHLWLRKIDCKGVAGWELLRMIDMAKLTLSGVPTGDMLLSASVVSFAEDSDGLFLKSDAGVFMINLRSTQLRRVPQARRSAIYPYASFYTRGHDIVGIDDIAEQ